MAHILFHHPDAIAGFVNEADAIADVHRDDGDAAGSDRFMRLIETIEASLDQSVVIIDPDLVEPARLVLENALDVSSGTTREDAGDDAGMCFEGEVWVSVSSADDIAAFERGERTGRSS